jgi:hypothetical protein
MSVLGVGPAVIRQSGPRDRERDGLWSPERDQCGTFGCERRELTDCGRDRVTKTSKSSPPVAIRVTFSALWSTKRSTWAPARGAFSRFGQARHATARADSKTV